MLIFLLLILILPTAQDHDRRVREAIQQAFESLILQVKRNLAPYLKSIMGHWLIAQCDTYGPAASAAKMAFQVAFPPNKQSEAVAFCKEEITTVSLNKTSYSFVLGMKQIFCY